MNKNPERRGLGRGLAALLGEIEGDVGEAALPVAGAPAAKAPPLLGPAATVPIERLHSNPDQPRRDFPDTELNELAASIRQRGIIQPIVARPDPGRPGYYQIVAGERRWRAAQRAQLHEIPVVVREVDDRTVLELAIIENVQRSDLNPIEEANGYAQLIER
ncbi:MAG: ParB/RepB/Spo0J family partition protein, partial [Alphaproteobacteria bacterium]